MRTGVIIGLIVLVFTGVGFALYLIKLNRQAKKQQSEVDPSKLRRWEDN